MFEALRDGQCERVGVVDGELAQERTVVEIDA